MKCQFILRIIIHMQVASMRFPPLPYSKPLSKLKLHPTVMALLASNRPPINKKAKAKHNAHLHLDEDSAEQQGSLQRQEKSCKSVSSTRIRNKSCQLLGDQRKKICSSQRMVQRTQIPQVSAKSWMLYQMRQQRCLYGKRNYKKREIASLTKMMNLITILQIVQRSGVNPKKIKVKATKNSCSMTGTTAELKQGSLYSLYDLFYGMMLPSGNDAAYFVAEIGGFLLKQMSQNKVDLQILQDPNKLELVFDSKANFVTQFLKEMNRLSWKINMTSSNFANPHGLSNTANYSTALDVCKLCAYSMKNPQFRRIVSTQVHHYQYSFVKPQTDKENQNPNDGVMPEQKDIVYTKWQNTNKMLGQGWTGIKTGITPNAGPCLAASVVKTLNGKQYEFLVVLLNSQSMQARWSQVRRLIDWAVQSKLYI